MNITFNYFKHKYPGKVKFRDLTKDELKFAEEHFPEDLFLFLKEEGYCSYGEGFFHFVDPGDYKEILAEWNKPLTGHMVFCRTGVGDLFTWNNKEVSVLHVSEGMLSVISEDMFDFFKFSLGDEQYVNKTLYKQYFDKARKDLGALAYDECYGFVPALPLGGSESSENLHKLKIKEYLSILAQVNS